MPGEGTGIPGRYVDGAKRAADGLDIAERLTELNEEPERLRRIRENVATLLEAVI